MTLCHKKICIRHFTLSCLLSFYQRHRREVHNVKTFSVLKHASSAITLTRLLIHREHVKYSSSNIPPFSLQLQKPQSSLDLKLCLRQFFCDFTTTRTVHLFAFLFLSPIRGSFGNAASFFAFVLSTCQFFSVSSILLRCSTSVSWPMAISCPRTLCCILAVLFLVKFSHQPVSAIRLVDI